jgi:hypothetical protein
MEAWLAANWYWLLSIAGLFFIAYWRLGNVEKLVSEHIDKNNKAPHPACPVHSTKFDELMQAMADIKESVKLLDTRIYDFMRTNGYLKSERK